MEIGEFGVCVEGLECFDGKVVREIRGWGMIISFTVWSEYMP